MDETTDASIDEAVLDGNSLAGALMAALGVDLSGVPGRCANCGALNMIAQLRAYVRAPGGVLRCPVCQQVVLRVVETPDATYVDARGAVYLRFDRRAPR